MQEFVYLSPIKDRETGVPTGYYRCSLCNAELSPDPRDPEQMAANFVIHVAHVHRFHKPRIESVSETAARVVEEAIQKLPRTKSKGAEHNP